MKMNARVWSMLRLTAILFVASLITISTAWGAGEEVVDMEAFSQAALPDVSVFTGAATYSVPISVPPGRSAMEPHLSLEYNSYQKNGWLGMGWGLNMGAIRRTTKFGLDYAGDDYIFESNGASVELVKDAGSRYRAKIESDFSRYHNNGLNGWTVYSRDGLKYEYGTSAGSRQAGSEGIFKWWLSKIEDPNGNYLTVQYTRDEGQLYLSTIVYTLNDNGPAPSPKMYVRFYTETRNDNIIDYASRFKIETKNRLKRIITFAGSQKVMQYELTYGSAPVTGRSRLTNVVRIGHDGTTTKTLPAIEMGYRDTAGFSISHFKTATGVSTGGRVFLNLNNDEKPDLISIDPGGSFSSYFLDGNWNFSFQNKTKVYKDGFQYLFAELNGDGYTDIVRKYKNPETGDRSLSTLLAQGDGTFVFESSVWSKLRETFLKSLIDYNNDGITDIIQTRVERITYESEKDDDVTYILSVLYGKGDGTFGPPIDIEESSSPILGSTLGSRDFNGDGILDRYSYGKPYLHIYLGHGEGTFDTVAQSSFIGYGYYKNLNFTEVNGDGITDLVFADGNHQFNFFIGTHNGHFLTYGSRSFSKKRMHRFADVNADGLIDWIDMGEKNWDGNPLSENFDVYKQNSTIGADLLKSVKNGMGGEILIDYTPSSQFANENLTSVMHLVTQLTVKDGVGGSAVTTYSYENGLHDYAQRDFRGFKNVTRTNPDGSVVKTVYNQGEFRKGKPASQTLKASANGKDLTKTEYVWSQVNAGSTWRVVQLDSKTVTIYDNPDNDAALTGETTETYTYHSDCGYPLTRVITGTGAETITETYAYIRKGTWTWRKTLETISGGTGKVRHTDFYYDSLGNLTTREDICVAGVGMKCKGVYKVQYQYDDYGNVIKEWDANTFTSASPTVEYAYDTATNTYPVTITYATDGTTRLSEKKSWNLKFGKAATTTDFSGKVTTYTYDPLGRIKQVDNPDGGVQMFTYSETSNPRRVLSLVKEDANNWVKTWRYFDGLGRNIQTVTRGAPNSAGSYIVSKTHYDKMGRPYVTTGPFFHNTTSYLDWTWWSGYLINQYPWQRTFYDKRGRPTKVRFPDEVGNGVNVIYSYNGFAATVSNAHISTADKYDEKTTTTDHLGRIIRVVEHDEVDNYTTRYAYNAANDLTKVTDDLGAETVITYNTLGRKVKMVDPDMGLWSYSYDQNGNLISQTDANNKTVTFGYDKLNRLVSKTYPAGSNQPNASYVYCTDNTGWNQSINRVNRLQNVMNGDVIYTYRYDPMGRVADVLKSVLNASGSGRKYARTTYEYDLSGKVSVIYYPEDDMDNVDEVPDYDVEYFYHPGSNLIQKIVDSQNRTLATISNYQAGGKITKLTYHNQVKTTYAYSPFSTRLESISTLDSADDPIMDKSYGYTLAGNIEDINDGVNNVNLSYSYDRLHRLVDEVTSATVPTTPMVLDIDYNNSTIPLHAPSRITVNSDVARSYSYDANGNTTQGWNFTQPTSVVARNITYTPDNMPRTVVNGTSTTSIIYDADGKRARKTNGASATYYFGDHFEHINGIPTRYVFAGNLRIAKVTPTSVYYYHKDHLGSSTVMSTASGKKANVESTTYLPYGGERGSGGISRSSYKFTDQEFDGETGLYNYDARLYDPVVGLFLSADSIVPDYYNPQSLNRYSYCLSNPIIYTDPDGHREILEGEPNEDNEFSVIPDEDSVSGFRIVEGGHWFKDKVEIAIANAAYTGNYHYLIGVPADRYGFTYGTKGFRIGLAFGHLPDSPFFEAYANMVLKTGGGAYLIGGTRKNVIRGPKGGVKHTPGKGHDRKSQPQKKKNFQKKAAKKKAQKAVDYKKAKEYWDSLTPEQQKLLPELNPDA